MTTPRWSTLALALALPATAAAQPSLTIDGCAFAPDELVRALAQEGAPPLAIDVRCAADGTAALTVDPAGIARRREVDLRDVPPSLAPRVIALMVTAVAGELPPPAPTPTPPPAPPPVLAPPLAAAPHELPIDRGPRADHATYWLGEAQFVQQQYEAALKSFQAVGAFAESRRLPDAMYKAGLCQYELKAFKNARATLNKVISTYPDADAARLAQAQIEKLNAEGR